VIASCETASCIITSCIIECYFKHLYDCATCTSTCHFKHPYEACAGAALSLDGRNRQRRPGKRVEEAYQPSAYYAATERLLCGTPRLHQPVPLVGALLLTVIYTPTQQSPPHSPPQTFLDNECDVQTCLHVCTSHVRVLHVGSAHSRGRGDRWRSLHPPAPVLSNTLRHLSHLTARHPRIRLPSHSYGWLKWLGTYKFCQKL